MSKLDKVVTLFIVFERTHVGIILMVRLLLPLIVVLVSQSVKIIEREVLLDEGDTCSVQVRRNFLFKVTNV